MAVRQQWTAWIMAVERTGQHRQNMMTAAAGK